MSTEELVTFYEVVEIALNRRIRKWHLEHPSTGLCPKISIAFSASGWHELRATIPQTLHYSSNGRGTALRLYGGIRCYPNRGKWVKRHNYMIRIRTAPRLRQNLVP